MMGDYYLFFQSQMVLLVVRVTDLLHYSLAGYFRTFAKVFALVLRTFRSMMHDYYQFLASLVAPLDIGSIAVRDTFFGCER